MKINHKPLSLEVAGNSRTTEARIFYPFFLLPKLVLRFGPWASRCWSSASQRDFLGACTSFPMGSVWCIARGEIVPVPDNMRSLFTNCALMLLAWTQTCIMGLPVDASRKFSECHSDRQQPWHALKTANGEWLHLQFLWKAGHLPEGGHLAFATLTSS